ncbi:MAG: S41 family peptidase, partial [Xanthomarina sp.]
GIKGGDRIIMANGDSIFGKEWSNNDIIKKLKGPINTHVELRVYRRGTAELLDFKVKRNHVPIKSVDAAYKINDKLGYIKINRFAESTYKEFKKELTKLQKAGITELVLDLRGNPGGFLGVAEEIVDEFLEKDKLILFTKNKRGDIENIFATKKGDFEDGEVFVLIDENSASASEIIAGALQDNDKGTIIGRRSYGKGLVQREMDLGDGSAIRLTVSRYYTPTGRSIQRSYKNGNPDYYDEYFERYKSGELLDPEKIEVADSLKFTTAKGKVVYGGGGIIPDVFVPLDLSMQNETLTFLDRRGFISNFIFEELDKDRHAYDGISREQFIHDFEFDDEMVLKFQNYLNVKTKANITFVAYNKEVKQYIKATLADQLYGNGAFEEIINQTDVMIKKVLSLSNKGD